ncbi:MAG: STAS domain-containing protein [Bryobacteraceae bacterium]|nr:STAS domain-containing protein [Bryobacteraceae bacterium]
MADKYRFLSELLRKEEAAILDKWLELQQVALAGRRDQVSVKDDVETSRSFLHGFGKALAATRELDLSSSGWADLRQTLEQIAITRATRGFGPLETAMLIFSLKQPVFEAIRRSLSSKPEELASEIWNATEILDRLGLFVTEVHQKGREELIRKQQQEMLELSTPVVRLWEGVLALPLIGTLDSARTQVVMESLLHQIVSTGASIAIIDITGVPTVDTLVAQHLLKTVAAARLMGADCIISGIRPQIAQTIVHLGVELTAVITKATLADAFAIALQRQNLAVVRVQKNPPAAG